MTSPTPGTVTRLLEAARGGDRDALATLLPVVYDELRRLAAGYMRHERSDHTLQPTALVHEAYVRLVGETDLAWQNRAHFFGMAAQAMRSILVDHARAHAALKREGGRVKVAVSEEMVASAEPAIDFLALDEALRRLALMDEQQARIVELRFFAGLTVEETSEVMRLSPTTVKREWRTARAWLYRQLTAGSDAGM
jgi:RNA polymerase sigma factor (TIGR02999 family)